MTTPNIPLRRRIIELVAKGGSPHVATALSMVEILQAIFSVMDLEKIRRGARDRARFVMSKGHGAAALYAVMHAHGLMDDATLATFHQNGSLLAGHASHFVKYVEHSTGALGHGLAAALGMAVGLRALGSDARVLVLVGDGELHEGSNWEALMLAGHLGMRNLCVLIDHNGYDQMGPLEKSCDVEPLRAKLESFKFQTAEADGHSTPDIGAALGHRADDKPTAVICRTVKGKGVSFMEGNTVWHYRTPAGEEYQKALSELA